MDTSTTATHPPGDAFAERYRAIASRDRRFDGQFITAVRSTGIYCRPSCPARTPKPENVTFYLTSAAAHDAGYRACKRCLPEAVPGTPAWDLGHDLAARAMRLLRDGVVDREGVDGLAQRLGYSARHVHRVLVTELGAGPIALARALRAQTARTLLTETDLRLADIAFAAGFGSIRQFNDTVTEVFDVTPSDLRARRRGPRAPSPELPAPRDPGGSLGADDSGTATLTLALPFREPYDAEGIFAFLAARAVDGVEVADAAQLTYARSLALPRGPGAFEAAFRREHAAGTRAGVAGSGVAGSRAEAAGSGVAAAPQGTGRFTVRLELTSVTDLPAAIARIRRLFDLDADPIAVDRALAADPALVPSVRATPGIRVPGAVDPTEILVRALVGQQISVAAARTHLSRLASVGTPFASRLGPTRLFPTADQLAAHGRDHLRGPARRTEAILGVVQALADGELALSPADDPETLRAALVARDGVGPWTAAYVAMRVLHDPDILLTTDGALLAGARALGLDGEARSVAARGAYLARRGERWAPWRSYASMHLWRASGGTPTDRAPAANRARADRQPTRNVDHGPDRVTDTLTDRPTTLTDRLTGNPDRLTDTPVRLTEETP